MTDKDRGLLNAVKQMEEEAPSVGLCGFAFKILYDEIEALISERDALLEAQRWIPVTNGLPEPETDVEVSFDDGQVWMLWQNWKEQDERDEPLFYMTDPFSGDGHTVTHWRPAPKAPEVQDGVV